MKRPIAFFCVFAVFVPAEYVPFWNQTRLQTLAVLQGLL